MKNLFNIFTRVKTIFKKFKIKIKMHIFNLLGEVEQQFAHWYYFELNIKSEDFKNEYLLPVFCCMKQREHAESLMNQIQRDLNPNFVVLGGSITELTAQQKNKKIQELQLKYAEQEAVELRALIYEVVGEKKRNAVSELFSEEDLNPTNLDSFKDYKQIDTINLRLNILKNQAVPFHQIRDSFIVKIDKSKLI